MKFLVAFGLVCLVALATSNPLIEECDESVETYFAKDACVHVVCYSFKNETVSVSKLNAHSCLRPKCDEGKEYKGLEEGDKAAVYPGCCAQPVCE